MPNITTNAAYQQILSMALEERSSSYQDLVSNNNALLAVLKRKGLWQTYSGPRIRQTLQIGKQVAQWYSRLRPAAQPRDRSVQRRLLRPQDGRGAGHPVDAGDPEQRGRQPADGRLRQLHRRGRACAGRHHGRRRSTATAPPTAASSSPASPPRSRSSPTPASTAASTARPPRSGRPRPTTRTRSWRRHSARRSTRPPSVRCSTTS